MTGDIYRLWLATSIGCDWRHLSAVTGDIYRLWIVKNTHRRFSPDCQKNLFVQIVLQIQFFHRPKQTPLFCSFPAPASQLRVWSVYVCVLARMCVCVCVRVCWCVCWWVCLCVCVSVLANDSFVDCTKTVWHKSAILSQSCGSLKKQPTTYSATLQLMISTYFLTVIDSNTDWIVS